MKLVIEGLHKSFRDRDVLVNINAELSGGLNVVIGPNGIGKSTLLRIIAGLYRPSKGRVYVEGRDEPVRELAYYVPEVINPVNIDYSFKDLMRLLGIRELPKELPGRFGLTGKDLSKPLGTLSAGMRKKVLLMTSIALKDRKPILLYDEPFANLDPSAVRGVQEMILGLSSDHLVIVSTHIMTAEFVRSGKGRSAALFTLVGGSLRRIEGSLVEELLSLKVIEGPCDIITSLASGEEVHSIRASGGTCKVYARPSADVTAKLVDHRGVSVRDVTMADIYEYLVGGAEE